MSNYFTLFRLPENYDIDTNALAQTHRALIAQFHPDKFAAASAFEQKQALMMTATLNEAHRVLNDPLDRAAYLLQKQGINADAPEHTQFAPEFLMQQMEWRETLMDAKISQNTHELNQLAQTIAAEQEQLQQNLQAAFAQNQWEHAAELVRQGRFLSKLAQEIHAAQE